MVHNVAPAPMSAAWRHTVVLLDRLLPPRSFNMRLWDGTVLDAAVGSPFTLILNHTGALRRMFTPPIERSLGEAFIAGDFDIDGDLFAAVALFDDLAARQLSLRDLAAVARSLLALPKPPARSMGRGQARLHGALHARDRDRAAVQYHYDVGNDFYGLWLDARMQYSCAYFPTGAEDLDTAQACKLDYICRKLHLQRGERLLDIGCGWGGLAMYAAERYGVHVLGITLSEHQPTTQTCRSRAPVWAVAPASNWATSATWALTRLTRSSASVCSSMSEPAACRNTLPTPTGCSNPADCS